MSDDVLERLRRANPVPVAMSALPIEPLLRRLDEEVVAFPLADETTATRSRLRVTLRAASLVAAIVASIAIAAVALTGLRHDARHPAIIGAVVSSTPQPGSDTRLAVTRQVSSLLDGIPQSGTRLGNPKAPVTVVVFADLECPICRDFVLLGGFSRLVANNVRDGSVKVEFRSFCTATCNGPGRSVFDTQQVAALAAGRQDLLWDYAEMFYREQGREDTGYVTQRYLTGLAKQVPKLALATWQRARSEPSLLERVDADQAAARTMKIEGTPTLIVKSRSRTERVQSGVPSYHQLQQAITQVQKTRKRSTRT